MKRILLSGILLCALLLSLGGCGKGGDDTSGLTVSEQDRMLTIGSVADGVPAYRVDLKNSTGKAITGVSVKKDSDSDFPENMLPASDPAFADGETRTLCYPSEDTAADSGDGKLLLPGYEVKLSFAEGDDLILHGFPFSDISEGELCLAEGVAYLSYQSVATGEAVSTLEAELAIIKAAETPAPTETSSEATTEVSSAAETPRTTAPSYFETSSAASSKATSSAVTSSYTPPAASSAPAASVPEAPSQQVDECLGDDGLTW